MVPASVERGQPRGHRQRSPNSAAPTVGRVHLNCTPLARARRRRYSSELGRRADPLGPAQRRSGCWPTSTFFWWNCCPQIRGRTMELGIGADADVGFGWSGGGDGAGADRAQPATGSSTTDRKICSTVSAASTLIAPLSRARGGGDIPASSASRPTCSGRLGGAAVAGRRRHFFLVELLFANSGADDGARDRRRC